jgi:hypothetical protein
VMIEALVENGFGCEFSRGSVVWEGAPASRQQHLLQGFLALKYRIDDSYIVQRVELSAHIFFNEKAPYSWLCLAT